ncbi:MAG: DUF2950 family protein [Candidatus Omnitrophota bacterium]|nr:DUF2950 family protein [Candidatus Omnitrophota bacterium]
MKKIINHKDGFTLVEIMIVVGIMLILAVIAIPAMIRSKVTGNEANAVAALRTISTSSNLYLFQNNDFPPALADLGTGTPPYIDPKLANASSTTTAKDGYYYAYSLVGQTGFRIIARPSRWRSTGVRSFSVDQNGIILYCETTATCNPTTSF